MTLDPEFEKQTADHMDRTLEAYRSAGASPRVSKVWRCGNVGDFLCGYFVGEMVGSALGVLQRVYGREPTPEDYMDIVMLVESRSEEIRGFFGRFNTSPE